MFCLKGDKIEIKVKKNKRITLDNSLFADQLENTTSDYIWLYTPHNIIHMLIRLEFEHKNNYSQNMQNYFTIFQFILHHKRTIKIQYKNIMHIITFGKKLKINTFCSGCKDCYIFKVFDILHPNYNIYNPSILSLSCLTFSYFSFLRLASPEFMKIIKQIIKLLIQHGAKKTLITNKGEIDIFSIIDTKYK